MKKLPIELIAGGTVTSPKGFHAGAAKAGIKNGTKRRLDIGILYSEAPCVTAAVFTKNKIKSAPVLLDQERLRKGGITAVIANSGNANASTGEQGMKNAAEMTALAARAIGAEPENVLVCSTGVIGMQLPMVAIREAVRDIALSPEGGHDLARAIMTTDLVPKEIAVKVNGNLSYTIGGIAKGSGMIHPNMGTMFGFITTDAAVEPGFLQTTLQRVVNDTFNMISVDGDTSPSDTVFVMANGLAKNDPIKNGTAESRLFSESLRQVCEYLAREIARDGEGAKKLIEVKVEGARTKSDARKAARTVTTSLLVKTAVHGADPNWGRILAALGRSGAELVEAKIDVTIGDVIVLKGGTPQKYNEIDVVRVFRQAEVLIKVALNQGSAAATAWGCDLSKEYVTINSQYMT